MPEGVPHGTEIKDAGTRYHDLIYAGMSGAYVKKAGPGPGSRHLHRPGMSGRSQ